MKPKVTALFILLLTCTWFSQLAGKEYALSSPDQKIRLSITVDQTIRFSISDPTGLLVENVSPGMKIGELILGESARVVSRKNEAMDQELNPVVPAISSTIRDNCNQLTLNFKNGYSLVFRAYDNGIAYRFETTLPGNVKVLDEKMDLSLPGNFTVYFPEEESLVSHYERIYQVQKAADVVPGDFCSLPVLFKSAGGSSLVFTEADLCDYPGMFLKKGTGGSFQSLFPRVVLETIPLKGSEDRSQQIIREAEHIAATAGTRSWPWRVFMIARTDGELLTNNLVFQLSRPLELQETDWIKPGLVAWDWWNALNVYGVEFESGINNETYKYYIDFAAEFGLDYIILDEGWSRTTEDVTACNPNIDVEELVRYGKERGVGVILWVLWKPVDDDMPGILDHYSQWGVKGVKVDFMQRADQYMVNFYERLAREAGSRKLLVDLHGAFKPSGLRRAYPNLINYEGVMGNEHSKWSRDITPEHNLTIPFIRMAAGPMDFTPGAMDNAHDENFVPRFTRPMTMGTRCHQLAMYVVYTSPLQMLCDNPSSYYREREYTEFIARMPTVWDESRVLEAGVSDYIVIARRRGDNWYIGAMTDGSPREFELDLSFLPAPSYHAEIMEDGTNAAKMAEDYRIRTAVIQKGEKLKIRLEKGGGWAAILTEN